MEEMAYYVGSIERFYGWEVTARRGCNCTECRSRTFQESQEDPRLILTVSPGTGAPGAQLVHARRSSVRIRYTEF